jgi:SprT protein
LSKEIFIKGLSKYLPENTLQQIAFLLDNRKVHLKITYPRSSKYGDYRAPHKGKPHRITVNHNLNKYAFLITLIHEIAHLDTWNGYKFGVKPHGSEWKKTFSNLMQPFMNIQYFPSDILNALVAYMNNPAASSCSDAGLFRVLKKYDSTTSNTLEDINSGEVFRLENGMILIKGEKLRTRYKCKEKSTGKVYFVNALAEVEIVDK